ncbi:hypothetical protein ACPF04_05565 [Campylobacter sp. MOP51]|uniref:hypothetical protein n=1 Tax=Campylobacter canis TaxID=3378588 RepID=UPI003C6733D7
MGGNATKHLNTIRFDKKSYDFAVSLIYLAVDRCAGKFNQAKVRAIPSYRTKADFGDCDLISTLSHNEFDEILKANPDLFKVLGYKNNDRVRSYAIAFIKSDGSLTEPFQVDHISIPAESYDFAYNYLSYNDLGNFIGRIASAFGLKFGIDGLYVKAYFKNNGEMSEYSSLKSEYDKNLGGNEHACVKKEKRLNLSFHESLKLLGFSPSVFNRGFNTLEDIYKYIVSNRFFHVDYFNLDNRNHVQRMRDKKRPTYTGALDFFKQFDKKTSKEKTRESFKRRLKVHYPQVAAALRALKKEAKGEFCLSRRIRSERIFGLLYYKFNVVVGDRTYPPRKIEAERHHISYAMFGKLMQTIKAEYRLSDITEVRKRTLNRALVACVNRFFERNGLYFEIL